MFKINDVVVYGVQGVCRITGTQEQAVGGENKTYFVLKPTNGSNATFYVPAWNEKALAKMRKILNTEEVNALIDAMPKSKPAWIENESERKDAYRKILSRGDHSAVISMIQALYFHKKEREAEGKRLHISDQNFLKDAEQLLYNEWQYVLSVDKEGLMNYIFRRIESSS